MEFAVKLPGREQGYPRRVAGRQAVAELYRPYGATIVLDRCYDLAIHNDQVTGVVVLEYAVEDEAQRGDRCRQRARDPTRGVLSSVAAEPPRSEAEAHQQHAR